MPDDEALHRLLRRMGAGDRLAVHVFYRRVEPFLLGLARRWLDAGLRRRLDSVDVAQSAFRRILRASTSARFEDEARVIAWVAAIVRNRICSEARKTMNERRESAWSTLEERQPSDSRRSPIESAADADEVEALRNAMDGLPGMDRQAIVLHDFHGLEFAEIARLLGRPSADAARKLHSRGVARLRKRLRPRGAT